MEILSNIVLSSVILSLIILFIAQYIFGTNEIETKDYVRFFIYSCLASGIFMTYHKKALIGKHGYQPVRAAAEVFSEISDSQQINGIMPINSMINNDTTVTGSNENTISTTDNITSVDVDSLSIANINSPFSK